MKKYSDDEINALVKPVFESAEEYKELHKNCFPDIGYEPQIAPLVRYPEEISFTEKIGNTEYTVNAHFRKDGDDFLTMLSHLFKGGDTD